MLLIYSATMSGTTLGVEGRLIRVEADISDGLPAINMVGMLSSEVKEAGERVRTALKNTGFSIPPKRITVNLSPADIKKQGTSYDLPIAAAILASLGSFSREQIENVMIMGELGLNGEIRPVKGVLPVILEAKRMGIEHCILPLENVQEGCMVEGMKITGAETLEKLCACLKEQELPVTEGKMGTERRKASGGTDFSEVNGQELLRRAAEIAAAGLHNLLMVGPPGSGKTMVARRIPTILPLLDEKESLELTKIYSASGLLHETGMIRERPFRAPHHSASAAALIGGGSIPRAGEVTLATHGILFLDELPEFSRSTLEAMRQPLEDREVVISRAKAVYHFPADFMLVAAMNPCKCGYYPDRERCRCPEAEVQSYQARISKPFLDRMDLVVRAAQVKYELLDGKTENESSEAIRSRVEAAQRIQKERYRREGISYNSQLSAGQISRFCTTDREAKRLLEEAYNRMKLTGRGYVRILKTARTIADLEACERIRERHISEAICLRQR